MSGPQIPLTDEIADRIWQADPGDAGGETDRYRVMAIESRQVIAEVLDRYLHATVKACVGRGHKGARHGSKPNDPGTACRTCQPHIRALRNTIKLIAPRPGE